MSISRVEILQKISNIFNEFTERYDEIDQALCDSLYAWLKLNEERTIDADYNQIAVGSAEIARALEEQIYQCVEAGADSQVVLENFLKCKPIGNFYYWEAIIKSLQQATNIELARQQQTKSQGVDFSGTVIYGEIDIEKMSKEDLGQLISTRLGLKTATTLAQHGHCQFPVETTKDDIKEQKRNKLKSSALNPASSSSSSSSSSWSSSSSSSESDRSSTLTDSKSSVEELSARVATLKVEEVDSGDLIVDNYFKNEKSNSYFMQDGKTGSYSRFVFHDKKNGTRISVEEEKPKNLTEIRAEDVPEIESLSPVWKP